MMRKTRALRLLTGVAALVLADAVSLGSFAIVTPTPAQAQFLDQRYPNLSRQRQQRSGGFFQDLFGGGRRSDDREVPPPQREREREQQSAPAVDNSRAPAPRRDARSDQAEPTTTVVVLGDNMADWLAYGLEDAFGDAPEISIVRKNKAGSGLLRYDARNDLDWWHVARDLLAAEKATYVVMMVGVADRQNIRERDLPKEADPKKEADLKKEADAASTAAAAAGQGGAPADPAATAADQAKKETDDEASIVAPEPKPVARRGGNGVFEFRSDQWEKIYAKRIDDTVAALKSKGVPVFWVGLPSIRGAKSTADAVYLNDLYRARAVKAGAVYVDVWDGFVDESGKFTTFGPDYEGQMRRLRTADGVYFTRFGARKLAHYVEREIRRYMSNRGPIALPSGPTAPVPADGQSAARPLAGPVVPLTTASGNTDSLLGGSAAPVRADAQALSVLVKGVAVSPPPGRADDFIWPPGSPRPKVEPKVEPKTPPVAVTPTPAVPGPVTAVAPASVAPPVPEQAAPVAVAPVSVPPSIAAPEPAARARPPQPANTEPSRPRPPQTVDNRPRPPQAIERLRAQQQQQQRRNDGGLFGPNGLFAPIR